MINILFLLLMVALLFVTHKAHSVDSGVLEKAPYSVCFTPRDQCSSLLVSYLDGAKKHIRMQAFSFTDDSIFSALKRAHSRGVDVIVLVDKINQRNAKVHDLAKFGVPVFVDFKPRFAHNKIILIDNELVTTGSYNYSYAAQNTNAENIIIIKDVRLHGIYSDYFHSRLAKSTRLNGDSHDKFR